MAEVGQAEPLGAGLASEVVLGRECRVQQGVQGGMVKVVVCGKVKLVKVKVKTSRTTHFYASTHWPHWEQTSASQVCLIAVAAAAVAHQQLHQRQCHAPETERCKTPTSAKRPVKHVLSDHLLDIQVGNIGAKYPRVILN